MSDVEIYNAEYVQRSGDQSSYMVHVKVLEDDDWVGDFFADFIEGPVRVEEENKRVFVCTPSDIRRGNGRYIETDPDFSLVEDATEELNRYGTEKFSDIDESHVFKYVNQDMS